MANLISPYRQNEQWQRNSKPKKNEANNNKSTTIHDIYNVHIHNAVLCVAWHETHQSLRRAACRRRGVWWIVMHPHFECSAQMQSKTKKHRCIANNMRWIYAFMPQIEMLNDQPCQCSTCHTIDSLCVQSFVRSLRYMAEICQQWKFMIEQIDCSQHNTLTHTWSLVLSMQPRLTDVYQYTLHVYGPQLLVQFWYSLLFASHI